MLFILLIYDEFLFWSSIFLLSLVNKEPKRSSDKKFNIVFVGFTLGKLNEKRKFHLMAKESKGSSCSLRLSKNTIEMCK